MFSEFKEFAMKGNLIDMAVGVVMGAAFGTVTKAFIDGMFMPLVGMLFQTGDLSKAAYVISPAVVEAGKEIKAANIFAYGSFIGAVINFLIVAFVMFMVIKAMNSMKKPEPEAAPAGPPANEVLLAEIRDLLKK